MDDSFHQDVSEPSRRKKDQMASRNLENLSSMVRVTQKEVTTNPSMRTRPFLCRCCPLSISIPSFGCHSLQKLLYHLPIPE